MTEPAMGQWQSADLPVEQPTVSLDALVDVLRLIDEINAQQQANADALSAAVEKANDMGCGVFVRFTRENGQQTMSAEPHRLIDKGVAFVSHHDIDAGNANGWRTPYASQTRPWWAE